MIKGLSKCLGFEGISGGSREFWRFLGVLEIPGSSGDSWEFRRFLKILSVL
jgi:hypothetical protein